MKIEKVEDTVEGVRKWDRTSKQKWQHINYVKYITHITSINYIMYVICKPCAMMRNASHFVFPDKMTSLDFVDMCFVILDMFYSYVIN